MDHDLIRLGLIEDDEIVIDEAALTLALLDHPDLDAVSYRYRIEDIALRLAKVADDPADPHARADALSLVIGEGLGFTGDVETYDDPANADLVRVLDRRRGLPISLSILYVGAARRLGWTANILDVPGHVLVLVGGEASPVIVDPFRGGVLVARDELAALLTVSGGASGRAVTHVAAMPNRAVLIRLLMNQAVRAEKAGEGRRALALFQRMTSLAPDYEQAWWETARLHLVDGDIAAARASLGAMLEITRDAELRRRVASVLNSICES